MSSGIALSLSQRKPMINTYNESDLHSALKKIYAMESEGVTEARLGGTAWICDVLTGDGDVIEIQTSNLSALTEKAEHILGIGKKLRIVHPVMETKWIELYAENGEILRRKKSPKKADIFDSLRGMTGICPLLLRENLTLELLRCEITEMRRKTERPAQIPNKSRRHLKDWLPAGKRLERILGKESLSSKEDWLGLIPQSLRDSRTFRPRDLETELKKIRGARAARRAGLLLWILHKMRLIELAEIKGRSRYYRISGAP